jgi:serine/threonine protein kinase
MLTCYLPPRMAVTTRKLLERLTEAGVLNRDSAAPFLDRADLTDPRDMAREIVDQGLATSFQCLAVLHDEPMPLVLGEYVLLDQLGEGGMGIVYDARHVRMDRRVAIKVLPRELTRSPDAVERFQREVRAMARLDHPNIVLAHDASESGGLHYLVMERVDGPDLDTLVRTQGPMAIGEALRCIRQAADALSAAHAAGIIHRDVKPGNLLLTKDGRLKLLDLGIARLRDSPTGTTDPTLTRDASLLGTVAFMAPEHAEDPRKADERSDIYSLGCTLYCVLTGDHPFDGPTTLAILLAAREGPVPDVRRFLPKPAKGAMLLDELQAFLARMMARYPEQRPGSMAEVIQEIDALLAGMPPEVLGLRRLDDMAMLATEGEEAPTVREPASATAGSMPTRAPSRPRAASTPAAPPASRPAVATAPHAPTAPSKPPASRPPSLARPAAPRPAAPTPAPAAPSRAAWWITGAAVAALAIVTTASIVIIGRQGAPAPAASSAAATAPEAPTTALLPPTAEPPRPGPPGGGIPAPPTPPTEASINVLAGLLRGEPPGWRVEGPELAFMTEDPAPLVATYPMAPGYLLRLGLAPDHEVSLSDVTLSLPTFMGTTVKVHLDVTQGSAVSSFIEQEGASSTGAFARAEHRLLGDAGNDVAIEVHPTHAGGRGEAGGMVVVRVAGEAVLQLSLPDEPDPGAARMREGRLVIEGSGPMRITRLEVAPFSPPDREMGATTGESFDTRPPMQTPSGPSQQSRPRPDGGGSGPGGGGARPPRGGPPR